MPRQITPRPVQQSVPNISLQHIDRVLIEAALANDGSIDPLKVFLTFDVVEADDSGNIHGRSRRTFPLADWPAQIRTDVIALRNHLLAAAATLGLVESGTDTGELS